MKSIRRHFTYANIAATLALALALGGTSAYAATLITSKMIKNGTIQNIDIHNNAIHSNKIHNGTIQTADLSPRARSLAIGEYYSNSNGLEITPPYLAVENGPAIPRTATYLITANASIANTNTSSGAGVSCILQAGNAQQTPKSSQEDLALQPGVAGNAAEASVSLQLITTLTPSDYMQLGCGTNVTGVWMIYTNITAVVVDSGSETIVP